MGYTSQKITPEIKQKLSRFMSSEDTITLGNYALDFSHTYNIIKFTPSAIVTERDGKRYLIKVEKYTEDGDQRYYVYAEGRKFIEIFN